ncbi:hypothetical protein LTR53_017471 [Teratosphaeriaceae sp. CCFEE 6253]|nr:hypothetical protein LTR53_017471 [Teratosphaeriaceae sp. CCFEE 6253]
MHFANLTLGYLLSLAQSRLGLDSSAGQNVVSDSSATASSMASVFTLPPLEYDYDALEPHFDAETMRIHHTKHHQTYVNNLNAALKDTEFASLGVDEIMVRFDDVPADKRTAVRNHGGGHANHSFFWKNLKAGTTLTGPLEDAIGEAFGSFEVFQTAFEKAATTVFGSGWAWLVLTKTGKLKVVTTANQDSPLMGQSIVGDSAGSSLILGLDVWEHAYYLKYRNVRPDYIKAFWHVVNWEFAGEQYEQAQARVASHEQL